MRRFNLPQRRMLLIVGGLLPIVILVGLALIYRNRLIVPQEFRSVSVVPRDEKSWSERSPKVEGEVEPAPVQIALASTGTPSHEHISAKAMVTNISNGPVAWDREFAVFLEWNLWSNGDDPIYHEFNKNSEKLPYIGPKERFIVLKPGESYSKVVELTKAVRVYYTIMGLRPIAGGGLGHTNDAIEGFVHFEVPTVTGTVSVGLDYDPFHARSAGFRNSFGVEYESVGLPRARVKSNLVRIPIGD